MSCLHALTPCPPYRYVRLIQQTLHKLGYPDVAGNLASTSVGLQGLGASG